MSQSLTESLPLPQRLAFAYAPAPAKSAVLALFAFDARLAQAIRQASEPIMAQMRLAWWRDQFRLEPARRERSDELVRALDNFAGEEAALTELVDGWESLLADQLDARTFARGRAAGFGALAAVLGTSSELAVGAGRRFALVDLAANLENVDEKQAVLAIARDEGLARVSLPRPLRSLALLDGLARRSLARGGKPLLDGPGAMLAAIRMGLTGR